MNLDINIILQDTHIFIYEDHQEVKIPSVLHLLTKVMAFQNILTLGGDKISPFWYCDLYVSEYSNATLWKVNIKLKGTITSCIPIIPNVSIFHNLSCTLLNLHPNYNIKLNGIVRLTAIIISSYIIPRILSCQTSLHIHSDLIWLLFWHSFKFYSSFLI